MVLLRLKISPNQSKRTDRPRELNTPCNFIQGNKERTVIMPVAALTPASPNKLVAASVTRAVAAILTTLTPSHSHDQLGGMKVMFKIKDE